MKRSIVYTASEETLNFWRSQSGSDLNDREEGDIEAISPTSDRSKMGRYDGHKKLRSSPLAVYLLVNFGGPRDLLEVEEFLISLLTDQEVIRTPFPAFIHKLFFTRVAKKRTQKVIPDYAEIGGKSPIFEDTEVIAKRVGQRLEGKVLTFHRYLPKTHRPFLEELENLDSEHIRVLPLFPQFSYATTGSIALWFSRHLSSKTLKRLQWIRSYPDNGAYIAAMKNCLREFLTANALIEEETVLLFSAHGLPKRFIATGDIYQKECIASFERIAKHFPRALSHLCYQSQFGKEEWVRPYTADVCAQICDFAQGRQNVVVIPLSFTSDHIETLYEIDKIYLASIRKSGLKAFRCPALNFRSDWLDTIVELFQSAESFTNRALLRRKKIFNHREHRGHREEPVTR